jgi:hypothetical protein
MRPKKNRTRLWVNPAFQFRLLTRITFYFVLWTFVVFHTNFVFLVIANVAANGPHQRLGEHYLEFLSQQKALLVTLALVTPVILYDLLKFSHRIAGPLYRCQKLMQEMAAGKPVPEFKARKRDLMAELFQAFNALIREWNRRVSTTGNAHPGPARLPAVKPAETTAKI